MPQRYDSGRLSKAGESPTGGARLVAHVSRTGVQVYKTADGKTRSEYRSPAEVFAPASLASFIGSALTIGHPPAGVNRKNYAKENTGTVIAPTQVKGDDGHEYVAALCDVNRDDAVSRADTGELVELSVGYRCDWDPTPGIVPAGEPQAGQHFDGQQRNIVVNHVAMLPEGRARAGRNAKFQTDSAELDADGNQLTDSIEQKEHMKFIVDGIEYEAGPALQDAIKRLQAKHDAETAAKNAAVTECAKSDAKADAADVAKKAAEALVAPGALAARVDEEIAFRASVSPILDETDPKTKVVTPFAFAGKSRRDVKTAVVKKLSAKDIKADAEDGYVDAYFDQALESHKAGAAARASSSESYVAPKTDSAEVGAIYADDAAWNKYLHGLHGKDITPATAAKN